MPDNTKIPIYVWALNKNPSACYWEGCSKESTWLVANRPWGIVPAHIFQVCADHLHEACERVWEKHG